MCRPPRGSNATGDAGGDVLCVGVEVSVGCGATGSELTTGFDVGGRWTSAWDRQAASVNSVQPTTQTVALRTQPRCLMSIGRPPVTQPADSHDAGARRRRHTD